MIQGPADPIVVHAPAVGSSAAVAFPQSTWTSFDRYDRYAAIAGAVRSSLGPGRHRVLDVGDTAGYLAHFDPELDALGIDVELNDDRLASARPLVGSGAALPFVDGAFDAVVSSDVLEHVAVEDRSAFLTELARVSRDLVVVAAPFDTPGVAGVEDYVRRYAMLSSGQPQPQLEEHHANGLPGLEATVLALTGTGREVAVIGNGNLWDWLVSMLVRFQIEARPALQPLSTGYDLLYNQRPDGTTPTAPPFYRHLVAAWQGTAPAVGAAVGPPEPVDLTRLAAVLVAADASEAVRQDVHGLLVHQVLPPVATIDAGLNALHERVGSLTDFLLHVSGRVDEANDLLQRLDRDLDRLHDKIDHLADFQAQVNAPVLRVRREVLRVRDLLRRLRRGR